MTQHRFVRVQDELHGLHVNQDGDMVLVLGEKPASAQGIKSKRNTVHFCIDGVVSDHANGSWTGDNIVIIADPATAPIPAGCITEDTWFLTQDRKLNLGRNAIVLMPDGVEASDIPNTRTIRYDASAPNAREKAVEQYLTSIGIQYQHMTTHGWDSLKTANGESRENQPIIQIHREIYGSDIGLYTQTHASSLENSFSTMHYNVEADISEAMEHRYIRKNNDSGTYESHTELKHARDRLARDIQTFIATHHPDVCQQAEPMLNDMRQLVAAYDVGIEQVYNKWERNVTVTTILGDSDPMDFDESTTYLQQNAGIVENITMVDPETGVASSYTVDEWCKEMRVSVNKPTSPAVPPPLTQATPPPLTDEFSFSM